MSHGVVKDGVYYKREKEKDQLRMGGGSWSINLDELNFTKVHTIVFVSDKATYTIGSKLAATHGFERILGGEKKLVVPLKHWSVDDDPARKA